MSKTEKEINKLTKLLKTAKRGSLIEIVIYEKLLNITKENILDINQFFMIQKIIEISEICINHKSNELFEQIFEKISQEYYQEKQKIIQY